MLNLRAVAFALFTLFTPDLVEAADLSGTVKDDSGGAVAHATIVVLTARQAVVVSTRTNASGGFTVPGLPDGEYVVRVTAAGFANTQMAVTMREGVAPLTIVLGVAAVQRGGHGHLVSRDSRRMPLARCNPSR